MNLLITGDWHITDKAPESRTDNYKDTLFGKLEFIFNIAEKNNCIIIQPGDSFDGPNPSYKLFIRVVQLLNKYKKIKILSCFGQHDLRYRNKGNTALDAIEEACPNFHILSQDVFPKTWNVPLHVTGVGYNEEIPQAPNKTSVPTILLIHKMIVEEKLWNAQEDYEHASHFLRKYKYDLIVSGDNHKSFISGSDRFLINCGSMLRSKIDQIDHKPMCVVFNTETKKMKTIYIPIEPAEKVFKMEQVAKEKEIDENLTAFVAGLSEQKDMGLSFYDDFLAYCKQNSIDDEIIRIVEEAKNGRNTE